MFFKFLAFFLIFIFFFWLSYDKAFKLKYKNNDKLYGPTVNYKFKKHLKNK